jgi:hypothetical protein
MSLHMPSLLLTSNAALPYAALMLQKSSLLMTTRTDLLRHLQQLQ